MAASYNCDKLKTKSRQQQQQQLAVASPTALFLVFRAALFTFLFATLPCLSTSDRHEVQKKLFTGHEVGGREWLNCSRPRGVETVHDDRQPELFRWCLPCRLFSRWRSIYEVLGDSSSRHVCSRGEICIFISFWKRWIFEVFQWANITCNCIK